jgi:putative oxidoreductase
MVFLFPEGFVWSWVNLERWLELGIGLYFIYFALNAYFQWQAIPHQSRAFEKFIQALVDTQFLMPVVKTLELIAGVLLFFSLWPLLATMILAPIVFMIVSLHLLLNPVLGYRIALVTLIPFTALILCQFDRWKLLWSL